MLRTGRLDLNVFVSPPDEKGRLEIIKILTDGMPISKDVDLNEISVATQSYSGADLASLCREAAVEAMQNNSKEITSKDFAAGLKRIRPSITKEVETWYEKIKEGASNIIPREADKTFYGQIDMTIPIRNHLLDLIKQKENWTDKELQKALTKEETVMTEGNFNKVLLDLEIM